MNIIEINTRTLEQLKNFAGFKDLYIKGNDLVYNGERIDISKFNINDLLNGESLFSSALGDLTSKEIFDIIRLHAMRINSITPVINKEEDKLTVIQRENPLMKNVSFVSRNLNGYNDKYLNIVDGMGKDHLYYVDRTIDIFRLYDQMVIAYGRNDITPDEFIRVIDNKLPNVSLESARDMQERSNISEDYQNKINNLDDKYKSDKTVNVLGNEEHDISVVSNGNGEHQVVTYSSNEHGDLIATSHGQNVNSNTTSTYQNEVKIENDTNNSVVDSNSEEKVDKKDEDTKYADLIPLERFYRLLDFSTEWSEAEKKSVELYYAYFGDLILYEDYLLPELREILNRFRYYIFELETTISEGLEINEHQQEACNKLRELEEKKHTVDTTDYKVSMDNVKKLELKRPTDTGSISTTIAVIFILVVTLILTVITVLLLT